MIYYSVTVGVKK